VAINIVKQIPPAVLRACLFISLFRAIVDLDNDHMLMVSRCTNPSNDRFEEKRVYDEIHLRYALVNTHLVINVLIKENRTNVRYGSCKSLTEQRQLIQIE